MRSKRFFGYLNRCLAAVVPTLLMFAVFPFCADAIDFESGLPVRETGLTVEGTHVKLSLPNALEEPALYLLFYSPDPGFDYTEATLLGATQRSFYVDPISLLETEKSFYRALRFNNGLEWAMDEIMIEDFEDGTVTLQSYPGQDQEPNAWEITSQSTYDSTLFALMIYGNSWKIQPIDPIQIDPGTVWRAATMAYDEGEIQAFGVGDGQNELFYVFDGSTLPTGDAWNTVFQGIVPDGEWGLLNMPIANDWMIRYGEFPTIDRLFYVNDIDEGGQNAISLWDEIHDITEDLPNIPQVYVSATGDSSEPQPSYQFTSTVYDPDSPTHTYHWNFGDGTTSTDPNPSHIYDSPGYRMVGLIVMDDDSLFGDAAIRLLPPPGTPDPEFKLNDAGDVMLARRYEEPWGIIPNLGVNAIFERTKPMFGDSADYSMINLECPLTDEGYPHPTKEYYFRGSPENVTGLQFAGFDYVALGNNHATDYMEPGLIETQTVLDTAGFIFSGAGLNEYWATRPAFFTVNGIRVAVLSYCNRDGREDFLPPFLEAGYNKAGFAMFDEPTLEATIPAVDSLADIIIIQAHVGTEYDFSPLDQPSWYQPELPKDEWIRYDNSRIDSVDRWLEHRAIELGADVLFCHHPHVLRGFELYQDKLICHSFGNFAFDQNHWETYMSMILYCTVTKDGIKDFEFKPVYIDDYIPTPASGELGERIMRMLAALSEELETDVAYDSATQVGRIATDDWQAYESTRHVSRTITFNEEGSYWVSEPIRIEDPGFLSALVSLSGIPGGADLDLSLGREILMHGGFEYEGGWLWNFNSDDEYLESMYPHSGTYCLGIRRSEGQSYVTTDQEDNIPIEEQSRYTVDGYMAGSNCRNAQFGIAYYSSRFAGNPFDVDYIDSQQGDLSWTRFYRNVTSPNDGWYARVRCRNQGPQSGLGTAFFDDLALIEWTSGWTSISTGYYEIRHPNESTYFQIRCDEQVNSATMTYELTEREIY